MRVPGYDYIAFREGIAARDGLGCYVRRLLIARRKAQIEKWAGGPPADDAPVRRDWIPADMLVCDGDLDGHHAGLSKQWLKSWWATETRALAADERLAGLLNDPRNGILVCRRHHELLENARIVIARADLPECVEEFAAELGDRALARLDRDYGQRTEAA